MTEYQKFDIWRDEFQTWHRTTTAFQALAKHFQTGSGHAHEIQTLRESVTLACYGANQFRPKHDFEATQRRLNRKVPNTLPPALAAIKKLRAFIGQHRVPVGVALGIAEDDLKDLGISFPNTTEDIERVDILDKVLHVVSNCLSEAIPIVVNEIPLGSRTRYGCLQYPVPFDDVRRKRNVETTTLLLFDLVRTFRLWAHGSTRNSGIKTMPKDENLDFEYSLACHFVNATFHTKTAIKVPAARDRLVKFTKNNPLVRFIDWPVHRPPDSLL